MVLRPTQVEDVPAVTVACQDPEISRWTRLPSPYSEAHARAWIEAQPEEHALSLLAFEAETEELLGSVGLVEIDRERGWAEIGFWTAPWARRRGTAVRAVRLLTGWAFDALALARIQALVREENFLSQRVLERAGFTREGLLRSYEEIKGERWDMAIFSLLAEEMPWRRRACARSGRARRAVQPRRAGRTVSP
jgi:ribosomal-protein-alanine N-acetyltransferase